MEVQEKQNEMKYNIETKWCQRTFKIYGIYLFNFPVEIIIYYEIKIKTWSFAKKNLLRELSVNRWTLDSP